MFNFRRFFEFLFKSFDISGETKVIEKLESEGVRFLVVIKMHWMYGVLGAWRVIAVMIIAGINAYLLYAANSNHEIIANIVAGILVINVIYWSFIIYQYLTQYYRIQGSKPQIEDIYTCINKAQVSSKIFTRFFNQTILLLLLLLIITLFAMYTAVMSGMGQGGAGGVTVIALNIVLLIVQLGLFTSFLLVMINQQMDFRVIRKDEVLFYDQRGFLGVSQNMNATKIRTINTKYPGMFSSFFNYGTIVILTEGDMKAHGEMKMEYVGQPPQSVEYIQKVLNNDLEDVEKKINVTLNKYKIEAGVKNLSDKGAKDKLKTFLSQKDQELKQMFESGDEEIQSEIKEIYQLLQE